MSFLDNIKDDIVFLRGAFRALRMTTPIAKNPTRVFPARDRGARRQVRRCAGADLRSRAVELPRARRAGEPLRALGAARENLAKGETVCLLMPNRPEYMAAWIGITSAGGVAALINTNLVGTALAHCIDIVAPKHVVVAAELADGVCHRARAAEDPAEDLVARRERANSRGSTARSTPCPATASPPPSARR